jgi:4-amino-4-deoxy-L-arabinose transferase-like glycosyltransferase
MDGKRQLFLALAILIGWMPAVSLWLNPPVLTGDEAYYARVPVEMRERGDWLVPYFNGKPRYKKPPLMYWLVAVSQRIFGENEVASRLPSLLAVVLTSLLLLWFGLKTSFAETGVWAATIFLLNPMTAGLGNWGAPEATLCLFVTASILFGLLWVRDCSLSFWLLVSGAAAGLGVLTKGAPGLVLPVIVLFPLAFWRTWTKQSGKASWSHWVKLGAQIVLWLAVCLAIAAPWFLLVSIREGETFWQVFLLREHVRRVAEPMEGHHGPLWYYLLVIWLFFLPWSTCLLYAFVNALKPLRQLPVGENHFVALSMAWWAISVVGLFSLVATKLLHYIFPALPALAWLCASRTESEASKSEVALGFLLALLPVIGALYGISVLPNIYTELLRKLGFESDAELKALKFSLNLIALGFASVLIAWFFPSAFRFASVAKSRRNALLVSGVILTATTFGFLYALTEASGGRDAVKFWTKFKNLATFGSDTEWAVFYAQKPIPLLGRDKQKLRKLLANHPDAAILARLDSAPALRSEGLNLVRFGFWCVAFRTADISP